MSKSIIRRRVNSMLNKVDNIAALNIRGYIHELLRGEFACDIADEVDTFLIDEIWRRCKVK